MICSEVFKELQVGNEYIGFSIDSDIVNVGGFKLRFKLHDFEDRFYLTPYLISLSPFISQITIGMKGSIQELNKALPLTNKNLRLASIHDYFPVASYSDLTRDEIKDLSQISIILDMFILFV